MYLKAQLAVSLLVTGIIVPKGTNHNNILIVIRTRPVKAKPILPLGTTYPRGDHIKKDFKQFWIE